ncbi:hypothetical protein IX321_001283 [Bacteroides pyogenes]|nr:hypothetical protein [Bacteroides pyogenes]MBR8717086.1 hypothetical protein [Bacteroides pyogenes]MBR8746861.1 hypothetical protein [Bacteroides pyogenes]MBR8757133.1 hypothetical protein [Bacteroides pyogenes]MBR8780359.1 hypothetical protein [Bacteroides pyogenes]
MRKTVGYVHIKKRRGNFCLSILGKLQNQSVEDILIACVEGLKNFPDAILKPICSYALSIKSATLSITLEVSIKRSF